MINRGLWVVYETANSLYVMSIMWYQYKNFIYLRPVLLKQSWFKLKIIYIPDGIRKPNSASGIGQIHASIDNSDVNKYTTDDKDTTVLMP